MRTLFFTALAGLLVSCGQNSDTSLVATNSVSLPTAFATNIIDVKRSGNVDGRTIVLIPGLASNASVWNDTVINLVDDYDVRTVQVAGFAGTVPTELESGFTDAIATGLTDYLSAVPGRETVVVGHSMGGFVSLKAAIKNPNLIDEVVIVDSLPFLAGMFMPGITPEQSKVQGLAMAEQLKTMPREAFDRQQASGLPRLTKTQGFLPELEAWGKTSNQEMVADIMGELLTTDLRPALSKLTQPLTVLVPFDIETGLPRDTIVELYSTQYSLASQTNIAVIDGSFHFIMKDNPVAFYEELNAAIRD
ncbi:MAG: alpha/beta hydrolase [Litorimonas sp.]